MPDDPPRFPLSQPRIHALRSPVTARALACQVLESVERPGALADVLLDARLREAGLDQRERALAWELVYGVLRRRATLDWRLEQVADRPLTRLPLRVRSALRLGAYQLLYLDRIPASASVNEAVNLVKAGAAGQRWAGWLNAVLRNLIRKPPPPLPDPAADPLRALAIRYACPAWLVDRWMTRWGMTRAEALCRATVEEPPLTLRVNQLRMNRGALLELLAQAEYESRPTAFSPVGVVVTRRGSVTDLPGFAGGLFYVEDEAGQLIPPLLDPQPGERVLDACAAPGGKTTHLAALMQNRGAILAMDQHPHRLRLIEDNCRRLGVEIVEPCLASDLDRVTGEFDRILVDAPCSGLGVLRRHPEGKWIKTDAQIREHQRLQLQVLEQVHGRLRPGGMLVYSTCSIEIEETEQVVEQFCSRHAEFQREPVASWLPPSARAFLTAQGDLLTMPPLSSEAAPGPVGISDAFYAVRLRKSPTS